MMSHPLHQTPGYWAFYSQDPNLVQDGMSSQPSPTPCAPSPVEARINAKVSPEFDVTSNLYQPYVVLQSIGPMVPSGTLAHQGFHDPNLAQDGIAITPDFYQPNVALQRNEPTVSTETLGIPYIVPDYEDMDRCKDCLALYDDLVHKDPEMAISLADLLADGAGSFGSQNAVEPIPLITPVKGDTDLDTSTETQPDTLVDAAGPFTDSVQAAPQASTSHTRRRYKYECVVCRHWYDRAQRARDCANRDRGLTPYVCSSRCGRMNWCVFILPNGPSVNQYVALKPIALKYC
ncbi:hypothetical protein M408DRAFT_117732 [Serendipita vermifera MAFF 305830]|uniref:Uncharacterized protein n=1 Tax=Serendipita vermifera MAFF 305830 TaxID=933852 RepID=A0A0C2W3C1_SERVB|nr:hypothetical protein M408DRAFT_117732 [Serendipita vermifera MAFF 305830]